MSDYIQRTCHLEISFMQINYQWSRALHHLSIALNFYQHYLETTFLRKFFCPPPLKNFVPPPPQVTNIPKISGV